MNGYDQHSSRFARPGRVTVAEASGDSRSDGKASQTRDGANRYDTSTPERKRKALAAARRSDNPADLERAKKMKETNSTIEMLMLQQMARRDNRAKRRGGYRSPALVVEAGDKEKLPPWLQKDDDSSGRRRGKVAESVLSPQIKPRDTVSWNGFESDAMVTRKRLAPDDEEEGATTGMDAPEGEMP